MKRHGRECSRNTHRRGLLRGGVKRPGRILNQMQLRRSSAHGNEGPRDQVFIVIGRRRLIGFWMGGWYGVYHCSLTIETKVSLMSSKAMIGSVRLTQGWPKGGGRPPCGVSACTTCS
ncbi:hypothetical protein F9C07_8191 [Aspergillus flavus]|uniref:Uncharacterized protein n=1 Tax=Aspergillus flavus (strain ATCC 200026 / FGSC A1120 / IAM 13836 / NRRL 3357 / JCM 12722 / SRRC 167) TaxID=332952 RepID=A0A7U2N1C1_ASPFN|nr:hypothetical protein F9C07_8191 [Aspergillus flavus]